DVGNYIVNSLIPAEESSHCSHLLAVLIVAVIASDTIPEIFQLGGKIAALHARQPWRACTPDALTLLPVTNGAIAIQCLAVVGATRQTRRANLVFHWKGGDIGSYTVYRLVVRQHVGHGS